MKRTCTELYFSEVTRDEGGAKTSEVSIAETLIVEFDAERGKFKASDSEGHSTRCGYGKGQNDAVMDYLRQRLGLDLVAPKVSYSSRVY